MDKKRLGRYHRFKYLKTGETLLYEPKPGHFVWISMYLPPSHRGRNLPEVIFKSVTLKLRGVHHIHCSKRVTSFKKLSRAYHWEYKGYSKYFLDCSCFRFEALSSKKHKSPGFRISHELLKRRPPFKSLLNSTDAKLIIKQIDKDADKLK